MGTTSTVIGAVAGLAYGAVAAGLGLLIGSSGGPPASTTTAADVAEAGPDTPIWVASGETVLGPSVLVPVGLGASGGEAVFEYELVDIAPRPQSWRGRTEVPGAAVVAPERWTLLTARGEFAGITANPRARTARFAVPDDLSLDEVQRLRLDAWRMRMPATHRIDLAHGDVREHVVDDGTTVALKLVLEQANATVVQVRVFDRGDGFSAATGSFLASLEAAPAVSGLGPGWQNIGVTEGGVQLTFVGEELPDPIPIVVRTHDWTPLQGAVDVDLAGPGP